ncbi:agmatine deiminase [Candidatus Woesearchaeota archaeon]|nr:agmatine deiminase [Candidatus Woesearchaeota archaeon]MDP6647774.1 agmatine deiminase family protein [Candidatus Woesearchaeota archaeon]
MKNSNSTTPKQLNFRMPAEFEKQEALWIAWPHNEETWPDMLEKIENSFIEFVKAIHTGQKVKILVNDKESEEKVKGKLSNVDLSQIEFYQIKNVDAWIRDYGPIFVVDNKEKAMVKWIFNAWGNKYDDLKEDNIIPYKLKEIIKIPFFEPGIVLEGGSIEVNGTGTLLTTEQCLLNKNRNPALSKEEIENNLKNYLNVSNILWLKNGIEGDDTDGHIDDIARFVNKNTVVCCVEDNQNDKNHAVLKENYELLTKMKDEEGNSLKIVKLPMPDPVVIDDTRLPASHANFYIGNESVAVPIFGSEKDEIALEILQRLFPQRKVVGINCREMVYGLGTLHCASQQEPFLKQ